VIVFCVQALKARLSDLSRAFEEATVDKMEQLEKTETLQKSLDTVSQLRQVPDFEIYSWKYLMSVINIR
jgi:hypothetical protein